MAQTHTARRTRAVLKRHRGSNSSPQWRVPARLGALAHFRSQSAWGFADHGATRRQRFHPHLREKAAFDRADDRSILHAIRISQGDEPLFRTQAIDHSLLPAAEHRVRENGKMAEHPKKIHALKKRGHHITRPDWSLHLHDTV